MPCAGTGRVSAGDLSACFYSRLYTRRASPAIPTASRGDGGTEISVYITSAAERAPPGDKTAAEETANRPPWLKAELEIMRPRAVVALGGRRSSPYLGRWAPGRPSPPAAPLPAGGRTRRLSRTPPRGANVGGLDRGQFSMRRGPTRDVSRASRSASASPLH